MAATPTNTVVSLMIRMAGTSALPNPSCASPQTAAVSAGTSTATPVSMPFQNPQRGLGAEIPPEDRAVKLTGWRSLMAPARSPRNDCDREGPAVLERSMLDDAPG